MKHVSRFAFASALLAFATPALAGTAPWTVSEANGKVTMTDAGGARPAARGMVVPAGATLTTGPGARAVMVRGPEFVTVSANSRLRIPEAAQQSGLVQILQDWGNALFRIGKQPNPHFAVKTPYLAAVVKGTTFSITVSPEGASMQVVEGAVEVSTGDGGARELIRPGSVAMVAAGDRYRLNVQGQEAHVVDSPVRGTVPASEAPAATPNTEPPSEMFAQAPTNNVVGAAIQPKAIDLGSVTGGLVTGNAALALASTVLYPATNSDVVGVAAPVQIAANTVETPVPVAVATASAAAPVLVALPLTETITTAALSQDRGLVPSVLPAVAGKDTSGPGVEIGKAAEAPPQILAEAEEAGKDTGKGDELAKAQGKAADDAAKTADDLAKALAKAADDAAKNAAKAAEDLAKAQAKAAEDAGKEPDKAVEELAKAQAKAADDAAKDAAKAADDLAKALAKAADDAAKDAKKAADDAAKTADDLAKAQAKAVDDAAKDAKKAADDAAKAADDLAKAQAKAVDDAAKDAKKTVDDTTKTVDGTTKPVVEPVKGLLGDNGKGSGKGSDDGNGKSPKSDN